MPYHDAPGLLRPGPQPKVAHPMASSSFDVVAITKRVRKMELSRGLQWQIQESEAISEAVEDRTEWQKVVSRWESIDESIESGRMFV